jgi:UDP-N-acetylmuramoyl-tripeptide--D-alanyl-D-alanine ligase
VVRCSAVDQVAHVYVAVDGGMATVHVRGTAIGPAIALPSSVQPTNLACALAVVDALRVPLATVLPRISELPPVPNRLAAGLAPSGVWVIDDTFNSNPSGARAALAQLAAAPGDGRRVVVTPGMVELGPRQAEENRAFAAAIAQVASDLVIVGHTNRRALRAGASALAPIWVRTREEAVTWVRSHLGPADAVLYENDLPDHYR